MNKKRQTVFILCILIIAVGAGVSGYKWAMHLRNAGQMEALQMTAHAQSTALESTAAGSTAADSSQSAVAGASRSNVIPVNFDKLQASNPDIFAWLQIPDTDMDYPVAQHPTDDTYYLNHGSDGIYSEYGCPYIERADSKSLTQFNTVIYGHNMNDGSMFGVLHKYEDADFLKNHREITVYTPQHIFTYTVFAAVMYSDRHIPYYYDDTVEADRAAFLKSLKTDTVKARSQVLDDITVTSKDHILTLSTCDRKLRSNRYLVVSVLTQLDGQAVGEQ
ncbi:MAG: class B sortase [Butyrivibrio sp.]|jgi:sortase B|nr:class B sortase [Butyrivibrio sp.]